MGGFRKKKKKRKRKEKMGMNVMEADLMVVVLREFCGVARIWSWILRL
jgi:hypothetical protein